MHNKNDQNVNTVTQDMVKDIIINSEVIITTIFDKCTVVACKLPNGFIIVESSACVDPDNYDEKAGYQICMNKIVDKVWELEGYRLQNELNDSIEDYYENDYRFWSCGCYEDYYASELDCEYDCYISDIACDYCDDIDCEWRHK